MARREDGSLDEEEWRIERIGTQVGPLDRCRAYPCGPIRFIISYNGDPMRMLSVVILLAASLSRAAAQSDPCLLIEAGAAPTDIIAATGGDPAITLDDYHDGYLRYDGGSLYGLAANHTAWEFVNDRYHSLTVHWVGGVADRMKQVYTALRTHLVADFGPPDPVSPCPDCLYSAIWSEAGGELRIMLEIPQEGIYRVTVIFYPAPLPGASDI